MKESSKDKDKDKDKNCVLCDFKFTMFKRQHHCRLCDCVCCDDCSKKKALVEDSQVQFALHCSVVCFHLLRNNIMHYDVLYCTVLYCIAEETKKNLGQNCVAIIVPETHFTCRSQRFLPLSPLLHLPFSLSFRNPLPPTPVLLSPCLSLSQQSPPFFLPPFRDPGSYILTPIPFRSDAVTPASTSYLTRQKDRDSHRPRSRLLSPVDLRPLLRLPTLHPLTPPLHPHKQSKPEV